MTLARQGRGFTMATLAETRGAAERGRDVLSGTARQIMGVG